MPVTLSLSPEEWEDLKRDPRFQKVLAAVTVLRQDYTDYLAKGDTLRPDIGPTAIETARFVGIIWGLDALLEMSVE